MPNYLISDGTLYDANEKYLSTTCPCMLVRTPQISRPGTTQQQPACPMTLRKLNELREISKGNLFTVLRENANDDAQHASKIERIRLSKGGAPSDSLERLMSHRERDGARLNTTTTNPHTNKTYHTPSPLRRAQCYEGALSPIYRRSSKVQTVGKYYQLKIDEAKLNIVQPPKRQMEQSSRDVCRSLLSSELLGCRHEMAYDVRNIQIRGAGYDASFVQHWNDYVYERIVSGREVPGLRHCPDIKKPEKYFVPNAALGARRRRAQ